MRTAILYIAERCNQRCVFCLEVDRTWAPFVDPSTQDVLAEIERLHGRGARHITFMGGETFFRKDLPGILAHARATGFTRVGVTTNGTVLSKKGFIKDLVDSGLDFIELSVHGHTPELSERIVRSNVSYVRQASALNEINDLGGPFTIVNVVVCDENREHLVDVARYVCDKLPRVPKRFKFKFLQMLGLALDTAESGRGIRLEDVDPLPVAEYLTARGVPFWFYNFPLCRLGPFKGHAHETGTLGADETYFDYDHQGGAGYYDSGNQLQGHVWPAATCAPCSLRPICPGLEGSYRHIYGTTALITQHDDPLPILAEALTIYGSDPARAAARLEVLRGHPRPSTPSMNRPDVNLIEFRHPDEPHALELLLTARNPDERAYWETERFALSYRLWDGVDDQGQRPNVVALLDAVTAALEDADAAGLPLEEALHAISEVCAGAWVLNACKAARPPAAKPTEPATAHCVAVG